MSKQAKSFDGIFKSGFWEGQQKFSDGNLKMDDGTTFRIHRVVLSQHSGYFRAFFSFNENQETVVIPNIHCSIMESVLLYIYTGTISLHEKSVWDLMIASDYLLLDDLLKFCRSFVIRNLTRINCLSWLSKAWQMERLAITEECYRYALVNFEEILCIPDGGLKELPFEVLIKFLNSNTLNVRSERSVWKAIVTWTEADISERLVHVPILLTFLRLRETSDEELAAEILSHAIITNNPHCLVLIPEENSTLVSMYSKFEAMCYPILPSPSNPRVPSHVYIIAQHAVTSTKYGSYLFLTYDSNLYYWRQINETDFFIDTMVQIGRFIYIFNAWQSINIIFDIVEEAFLPTRIPPAPFNNCCMVTLNGKLYFIGGSSDGLDSTKEIFTYDSAINIWKSIEMPSHIVIYGAATLNELIYIVGMEAFDPSSSMTCRAYEPETDSWILMPTPNVQRLGFAVATFREKLFIISGENDGQYLKSVEAYDPREDKWIQLPDLPYEYFFPKAVIVNDQLIVHENNNEDTRYYEVSPPVYWDEQAKVWQAIDEKSPLCSIQRQLHLILDDSQLVADITAQNRRPGIEWQRFIPV